MDAAAQLPNLKSNTMICFANYETDSTGPLVNAIIGKATGKVEGSGESGKLTALSQTSYWSSRLGFQIHIVFLPRFIFCTASRNFLSPISLHIGRPMSIILKLQPKPRVKWYI